MRPTRLGVSIAGLSLLSLIAAGSTGNNLLYFLFAATAAGLALAAFVGRRNVKKLRARIEPPERAFRGIEFSLRVVVEGAPLSVARMVRAVGPQGASEVVDVPSHGTSPLRLRMTLPARGRWRLDGLVLESRHPFGMFTFRRPVDSGELVVWPQSGRGRAPLDDGAAGAGRTAPGTALAGDFYGPRPYATGDDVRSIHWKMSARAGRLVVAQYAASVGGKAMVRLAGVDDLSVERAAAECRTRLEAGATVGLIGAGLEVPPAAGTRQLDRILAALAVAGPGGSRREAPPARKARDEGPADSVELRRLTLLIGLVVYVSMFLIDDLSPTRLLMFAPLIPLGAWLHERGGPFPPARAWSVLSAVTLLYLLFVDWRISGVAMANAHLLGYLLANRLLSPWKTGELRQAMLIMFLAFFLVSGLTVSPWYFPAFLVWVGLGATWLALDSGANPRRPREWLPGLLRLSAAAGVLTVVLFMAVPRVEGLRRFSPFLASAMDKLQVRPQVVTGFTERVSLGYYGTLRKSSARVMRVHPDLPPRTELAAPSLYLRGGAFDRFDGRSWTKSRIDFNYIVGGQHRRTRGGRAVVMRRGTHWNFLRRPVAKSPSSSNFYP